MKKRVVITGIGVVSSLGNNQDNIIRNIKNNIINYKFYEIDEKIAAIPILEFNIRDYIKRNKFLRYLNQGAKFSVSAAIMAVKNSKLDKKMLNDAGLFVSSGPNLDISGPNLDIISDNKNNYELINNNFQALWILQFLPNTAGSLISQITGIHGDNQTICTACSASIQAIGEAFRKVRDGYLKIALAGGGDSRLSVGGLLAYNKANALWKGNDDPLNSYYIFDKRHSGFIPGEGGAFFVIEEMDHAMQRKAEIFAEVIGYGSSISGHSMTAPHPQGIWEEKALIQALKDSDLNSEEIEIISAHGTGTNLNDVMESNLIQKLFGNKPFVIALKSWIGHLASACGAVELAISIGLLKNNYLPRIRNLKLLCNENINYVIKDIYNYSGKTMLIENFGFGGQNAALIIKVE